MQDIKQAISEQCQKLFGIKVTPHLSRPQEQFGDYATNVALQLANELKRPPREIAESLAAVLKEKLASKLSDVTVAGPGFINLRLSDKALIELAGNKPAQTLKDQVVVAEYSDPNPFKILHAGHLYTGVVGDVIANLLQAAGAEVRRVNFGGDVGMHVGKTMWAMLRTLGGEHPEKLAEIASQDRVEWMAAAYVEGSNAYEDDEQAKAAIIVLNKRVYQLHAEDDHESPFAQIYWTARQWSYDYFDAFYARIGTQFERYYPESETMEIGLQAVRNHIGDVFEESDGAVIFRGEDFGLHNRVFINSEGLPTYEAKDVGLIMKKYEDYYFDQSVVITGNEQEQYMAVVIKAIEQFAPDLARATKHLTHGIVKLKGGAGKKGQKMSSRKGNILRAVDVLDAAATANKEATGRALDLPKAPPSPDRLISAGSGLSSIDVSTDTSPSDKTLPTRADSAWERGILGKSSEDEQVTLAAVKYSFLRSRLGADIIYDPAESVSMLGNSGPYLQYAHARARSILGKAKSDGSKTNISLEADERSLLRKITEYPEVVDQAVIDLLPSHLCTYLYELSQAFNRFYEDNRVIGNEREAVRLWLVNAYADVLKSGLALLGITSPDKM